MELKVQRNRLPPCIRGPWFWTCLKEHSINNFYPPIGKTGNLNYKHGRKGGKRTRNMKGCEIGQKTAAGLGLTEPRKNWQPVSIDKWELSVCACVCPLCDFCVGLETKASLLRLQSWNIKMIWRKVNKKGKKKHYLNFSWCENTN